MTKILTILIPTMKIHGSMGMVFPKLKTGKKEFVVGGRSHKILPCWRERVARATIKQRTRAKGPRQQGGVIILIFMMEMEHIPDG